METILIMSKHYSPTFLGIKHLDLSLYFLLFFNLNSEIKSINIKIECYGNPIFWIPWDYSFLIIFFNSFISWRIWKQFNFYWKSEGNFVFLKSIVKLKSFFLHRANVMKGENVVKTQWIAEQSNCSSEVLSLENHSSRDTRLAVTCFLA